MTYPRRPTRSPSLAGPVALGLIIGGVLVAGGAVVFRALILTPRPVAGLQAPATEPTLPSPPPTRPQPDEPKAVAAPTPSRTVTLPPKPRPKPVGPTLPPPPAPDAKVIESARETVPLPFPAASVKDVRFSPGIGDVPAVVVLRQEFAGFQGVGATDMIERVTRAGRPDGRVEVPADKVPARRPFAVTDTGQRVLVEAPAGTITVYDFEANAKVWDGVDVFADLKGRVGPPVGAFFVNPDTIAVVDRRGVVDTWDVAAKRRKAAGEFPGNAGGPVAATRGGGRTVVVVGRKVFAFVGESTATPPVAELPAADAEPIAADADPLGRHVAVVYRVPNQAPKHAVAVLRLGDPAPRMQTPFADTFGTPTGIGWVGPDTLGVVTADRAAILVDVESATPFAYCTGDAVTPVVTEFGLFAYTTADPADPTKAVMVGVEMPFARHRELLHDAVAEKRPLSLAPRAKGLAR